MFQMEAPSADNTSTQWGKQTMTTHPTTKHKQHPESSSIQTDKHAESEALQGDALGGSCDINI